MTTKQGKRIRRNSEHLYAHRRCGGGRYCDFAEVELVPSALFVTINNGRRNYDCDATGIALGMRRRRWALAERRRALGAELSEALLDPRPARRRRGG
ncbi:hypothetical protein EVAR_27713_1 [Eumeta japonica]|uniref:Uncharacterized protein n=1 Tax=Eumeta variegata TaxID=151549 RepID=A0A4C1WPI6_EUMVA|nr:hypothetical protein EVAR_27713_1 [Eumeta japonica]